MGRVPYSQTVDLLKAPFSNSSQTPHFESGPGLKATLNESRGFLYSQVKGCYVRDTVSAKSKGHSGAAHTPCIEQA